MTRTITKCTFGMVALASLISLGTVIAWADQRSGVSTALTKKQAQALEATANTPEEHLTLATYYREQARKLEKKARYNREMAEMYRQRPSPLEGKIGVPIQRRCWETALRFAREEQHAMALANFHAAKAGAPEMVAMEFAQTPSVGALRTNFIDTKEPLFHAAPGQSSLFSDWIGSSTNLYDLTRADTYMISANGEPPVELVQLQRSAEALFDAEHRFVESLTGTQRVALRSHLHAIEKHRHDIKKRLDRLNTGTMSPASASYFKAVSGVKRDLQACNVEQQAIASRFGFSGATLRRKDDLCVMCAEWGSAKQNKK